MNYRLAILSPLLLALFLLLPSWTGAATNIVPDAPPVYTQWAWNDEIGWIDFYNGTNGTVVLSSHLTGYASSSVGEISLDCVTTSIGNICGRSAYQVQNDGEGALYGWAWNDAIGWISFCGGGGADPDCPGSVAYRVLVNSLTGDFSGWAWSDEVGWINFNCDQPGVINYCGVSNHKVKTAWREARATGTLDSVIFDTGVTGGAQLNSLMWKGLHPVGTRVYFQLATGDCAPAAPATATLRPNGDSSPLTFSTFGAPTHFTNVDEVTADEESSYNYAPAANLEDLLHLDDATLSGTINSVTLFVRLRPADTAKAFRGRSSIIVKTNGVEYLTDQNIFVAGYNTYQTNPYSNNPNTNLPWTWSEINALEVGYKTRPPSTGSWGGELRVTQVYIQANYSPPATATCNPPSTWVFVGPDGTTESLYGPLTESMPYALAPETAHHKNKRFFRYRIWLESNKRKVISPRVDDVIVNWSP